MKIRIITLIMCVSIATAGAVWAHGGATGIVKERMEGMGVMAKSVKALASMMRGKTTYDADEVRRFAGQVKAHAGTSLTKLFPQNSTMKPSVAKPEIWSNWTSFEALALQLALLAEGLELAADNGLNAAGADANDPMFTIAGMKGGSPMMSADHLALMPPKNLFKMMAQTCSACHSQFRLEKN